MNNDNNKPPLFKRILKIVLVVIICLNVVLCSFVLIFGVSSSCKEARADEVIDFYSFQGSDVWLPTNFCTLEVFDTDITVSRDYTVSGAPFVDLTFPAGLNISAFGTNSAMCNFKIALQDAVYNNSVVTELVISNVYQYGNAYLSTLTKNFSCLENPLFKFNVGNAGEGDVRFYLPAITDAFFIPYTYVSPENQQSICRALLRVYKSSIDFNCNIYKAVIGSLDVSNSSFKVKYITNKTSSSVLDYYALAVKTVACNYIRYYDVNDNYIEFAVYSGNSDKSLLDTRTYYTASSITDNIIYQNGYNDGVVVGNRDGYSNGYNDAKIEYDGSGYDDGYNDGWRAGQDNEFSLGWFLQSSLNILDVKIFGLFSIGDVLMVSVGVMLVLIVLKIFAGG